MNEVQRMMLVKLLLWVAEIRAFLIVATIWCVSLYLIPRLFPVNPKVPPGVGETIMLIGLIITFFILRAGFKTDIDMLVTVERDVLQPK